MTEFPRRSSGEHNSRGIDMRGYFCEILKSAAALFLKDRLLTDAFNKDRFLQDESIIKVPLYVKMSFTNALDNGQGINGLVPQTSSSDKQDDFNPPSMQPTLTIKFTNPRPVAHVLSNKEYNDELYIHFPSENSLIPNDPDEIDSIPDPDVLYLEYRSPVLSKMGHYVGYESRRYKVTSDGVSPYTSYESGSAQHDEFDLFTQDPAAFQEKYSNEISASTNAMKVIETWDPSAMGYLKRD